MAHRGVMDRLIVGAFSAFALVSLVLEWPIALGVDLERATDPISRAWALYGSEVDPYLLHAPREMQLMFAIDAFVFGPFYLVLVYAFVRRAEWIRMPAILYASAMIYSLVAYYLAELTAQTAAATNWPALLAIGAVHTVMPFVLLHRVWNAPLFPPE